MTYTKQQKRRALIAFGPATVTALMLGTTALAQSAQPGAVIDLEPIVVTGDDMVSTSTELRDKLRETPGAADVVGEEELRSLSNPTVSEAMAGVPGVIVQDFFGSNDQPRFQIRGSGMQQSPTERGLLILQNGMPVNNADGSYIAGLAAPGMAESIEVWRGASANRLGASVLGGAVNFISPTAITSPENKLSFGVGSFGRKSASGQTSVQGERANALFQFELNDSDGFRVQNNDSSRNAVSANVELQHGDGVATQFFLNYTDLSFGVPGPLTKAGLNADPSAVHSGPTPIPGGGVSNPGPNVPRDKPRREATQLLAGFRTTIDRDAHRFDLGASVAATDDSFRFPIAAGERVTDSVDGNLSLRYAFQPDHVAGLPLFESTLHYAKGTGDREYYHNVDGARGAQFGENELKASTLSVHMGANIPLGGTFYISPSVSYTHATRDNDDLWTAATRPTVAYNPGNPTARLPDGAVNTVDNSYERSYSGWSPKLALTWKPATNQTAWVALSHSFEPPTHNDLLATSGGTPFSGPGRPAPPVNNPAAAMFSTPDLEAQEADTIEFGWRGQNNGLAWDVTAYHSKVKNEILSLRDVSAAPRSSLNADRTTHTGVELGLSRSMGSGLYGRLAYTWQDFRFDNDPVRGNNRLGGAPSHVITASLAWEATDRLTLFGTAKWVPEKTPVDNMNTLFNDPYFVADLRATYEVRDGFSIVAEVTNVFDEVYAGSTLVVDQARADQAAFIPGEGRAFYIGTQFTF